MFSKSETEGTFTFELVFIMENARHKSHSKSMTVIENNL